ATVHNGTDPVRSDLPDVDAYWEHRERWYFWDLSDAPPGLSDLLTALARAVMPRIEGIPLFWAVLGPFFDALSADHPEGFAHRIAEGHAWLPDLLVRRRTADAYDYWLRIANTDDADEIHTAAEALLQYLRSTTTPDVEAFFTAFDLIHAGTLA